MIKTPNGALNIIKTLKRHGYQAYLVGGCLRDRLLKLPVKEWDITTSAKPTEVTKLFKKVIPTGIDYGTVTILLPDGQYEVTTFRADEKYVDGRHPLNVVFTQDLHCDLARRDFTMNALAYDPTTKELVDDFNGQKDIKKRIIRAIGQPIERFSEDGLRSVRACRFAARLNFKIEPQTFRAIGKTLKITKKVAPERLHDELVKMLAAEKPSSGLELMRRSGLLKLLLPELLKCYGVKQPPQYHKYDVYWHSLYACDVAPKNNVVLRLAALLHDVGKPACKRGYTFYNHDKVSARLAEKILRRLKFSNDDIKKVTLLISHHMFNYTADWGDAAVRRFIQRVGLANLNELFALRNADANAMKKALGPNYLRELQRRIKRIVKNEHALNIKDLKINGHDVMKALKIDPGPKVGKVLKKLLEKVLDNPELNKKRILLKLLK